MNALKLSIQFLVAALLPFGETIAATKPLAPATILFVGDSISAAYGLKPEQGYVTLLQKDLTSASGKRAITVVNGSVSGDTTANGRARLPVLLAKHKPTLVVIALGGNDALRGISAKTMAENLEAMARLSATAKARVILVGLQVPPNFGAQYTAQFEGAYKEVASKLKLTLVPSILAPLGTSLDYFQADRIHPTAAAQPLIAKHLLPILLKAL